MIESKDTKSTSKVLPLSDSELSKKEQVSGMFDRISGKYDFLNHFLSMGIDKGWRKKAINSLKAIQPKNILDVATGTGDLAIAALRLNPTKIVGIDISEGMLEVGRKKIKTKNLDDKIELLLGDSEQIHFEDNAFDAITCAYGVRNFENLEKGLKEMARVMRSGGRLAILEFSRPKKFPVKQLYTFYFKNILPGLGKVVSKDKTAYSYLHESAMVFPEGEDFCKILTSCGFADVKARPLTFGITSLYTATKK